MLFVAATFLTITAKPQFSFAQNTAEVSQGSVAAALASSDKSGVEKAEDVLTVLDSKIPVSLTEKVVGILIAISAIMIRLYPSAKAWCLIFTPIASIFGLISSIFSKLQQLSLFLAQILNNKEAPK